MPIFKSQIDGQRFVGRMVPSGYHWWVGGVAISISELEKRHDKYREHYGCDLSPAKKSYRKKKGLANTHFIAAPLPRDVMDGGYIWFLLATDGLGPVRENSKLKDACTKPGRIIWGDYVLYDAPRHRLEGGGTRWSWYLKPTVQQELDHYIGVLLKQAPGELNGFLDAQVRRPLHHGVRHYLTRLIRRSHQNYTRMYPGKPWPARNPAIPLPILSSYKKQ